MALFKKKETEKISTSSNARDVVAEDTFITEPTEVKVEEPEPEILSLLELENGVRKIAFVNQLTIAKTAVKTDETIVRVKDGRYEVIGIGPIEVKVVEGSDEKVSLMMLDHMVKRGNLPEAKVLNIYKYELQNSDTVKSITGKTPAELNNVTEEFFASVVLKDSIDAKLQGLPAAAIIEAAKLPKNVQKILGQIVENIGTHKITPETVKALNGVEAEESAILMRLIKHMN